MVKTTAILYILPHSANKVFSGFWRCPVNKYFAFCAQGRSECNNLGYNKKSISKP